ncbi:hypothetical protein NDU88_001597 [Pleurodeles waltl]|uniref:Uncharacterized protein n=1 Tax=Pleurodeles waltl TaxID=8319 RepID=A0AAV7V887_PLEWA|nr:hypothetical protein NDU88_001597 [Pleurodeles waltl]
MQAVADRYCYLADDIRRPAMGSQRTGGLPPVPHRRCSYLVKDIVPYAAAIHHVAHMARRLRCSQLGMQ